NHLFANAKALMHAGLYFSGPEAERWYRKGLSIIERELPEQVLADGGHFERSTMYHAAALEDLLDLVNLMATYGRKPPQEWLAAIARMQGWLHAMSHPDGEIAFFNDAAFGMAPTAAELDQFAARLGLPPLPDTQPSLLVLEASGYVRAQAGSACLLCDCAPVGPDYLPGHAHADTLSFELSLGAQRCFVNSGTSVYGVSVERLRQRGTAAHNTLVVDGMESSEVWSGFRVARRARAHLIEARFTPEELIVAASHDGYRRLRGKVVHERRWTLAAGWLRIEDRLSGTPVRAEARFHLHPQIQARVSAAREVMLTSPAGLTVSMTFDGAEALDLIDSTWQPRFGMQIANRCIAVRLRDKSLTTRISWSAA
ncbi:MAG TPA: alginate lyase family protein, partial [Steroidobacteraceae bacterium]|nr:alginate lyase family protein [Steroidobacteraceae bacterium]